jgi:N-methylhydantoinase B
LAGGLPAKVGRLVLVRDGRESDLPPKADNVPLRKGDRVRLETSGGGGFGDPDTRVVEAVERDLALGYVTRGR